MRLIIIIGIIALAISAGLKIKLKHTSANIFLMIAGVCIVAALTYARIN